MLPWCKNWHCRFFTTFDLKTILKSWVYPFCFIAMCICALFAQEEVQGEFLNPFLFYAFHKAMIAGIICHHHHHHHRHNYLFI